MGAFKGFFSDYKKLSTGAGRYAGEFDAWQPIRSYAAREGEADKGRIAPILAKVSLPQNLPMQAFFEEIAKRVWKEGKVNKAAPQHAFLAATRLPQRPVGPPPRPGQAVQVPLGQDPLSRPAWAEGPRPAFVNPSGATDSKGKVEPAEAHLKGVARDWQLAKDLQRISAYTFRGDDREPHLVMKQGGFNPPSTRTDDNYLRNTVYDLFVGYMARRLNAPPDFVSKDAFVMAVKGAIPSPEDRKWWTEYVIWRAMEDQEKFHPGRMVAYEALKGYISTSRSVNVAKGFALRREGAVSGWVYMVLVEGGIVIPGAGHTWCKFEGEQEIAYPGSLKWEKIYGLRQVGYDSHGEIRFMSNQPLLLRKGFQQQDPEGFKGCYAVLSGKPQALAAAA
jgi:hypothetical protein